MNPRDLLSLLLSLLARRGQPASEPEVDPEPEADPAPIDDCPMGSCHLFNLNGQLLLGRPGKGRTAYFAIPNIPDAVFGVRVGKCRIKVHRVGSMVRPTCEKVEE